MGSSDPRPRDTLRHLPRVEIDVLSPPGAAWLTLGWLGVGLFAGTSAWLAAAWNGQTTSFAAAAIPLLVAGLCWVPITVGTVALTRRLPLERPLRGRIVSLYVTAAASVSFVLNAAWALAMTGLGLLDTDRMWPVALAGAIQWLHVNAAVFAVIVAVAHWAQPAPPAVREYRRAIRARSRGRQQWIDVDSIDRVHGAGDYATVHTASHEHVVDLSLKELEATLDPAAFARIHRSTIVAIRRIRDLRPVGHGDAEVTLVDGTRLRVARRRRAELESRLAQRELSG